MSTKDEYGVNIGKAHSEWKLLPRTILFVGFLLIVLLISPRIARADIISANAGLSSDLIVTGSPITWNVNLGVDFQAVDSVAFLFQFGDDALDPGECLTLTQNENSGAGHGFCNPQDGTPQGSRSMTLSCSPAVQCDTFLDGMSGGQISSFSIDDGDVVDHHGGASVSLTSLRVTVNGSLVQLGSITIRKETEPPTTTSFSFNGDLGSFSLNGGGSRTFGGLAAGVYTVGEAEATGWFLKSVECDGQPVGQHQSPIVIQLDAGQDRSCTFYSRRLSATPDAGGPYSGKEGSPIAFDASGTDNREIVAQYEWDCTGDGTFDEMATTPKGGACTYDDNGTYTVKLRAVDIFGRTTTTSDTAEVTVSNAAPTVNAGEDQDVLAGTVASFAAVISDPGTADTHTVEWDFGDGGKKFDTLTPRYFYAGSGRYYVTVTVTDDEGAEGSDELIVDVLNGAPILGEIEINPAEVYEGDIFTLAGTMADTSTNNGLSLTVDWGDGQTETKEFGAGRSAFSLDHSYADDDPSGTLVDLVLIKLELTDDEGASSTGTGIVKVHNAPPVVDAGEDKTGHKGESVNFKVDIVDPGLPDTHVVSWDFGDGSPPGNGVEAGHIYDENGDYTVTVTVEDDDGGVGEDWINVVVSDIWVINLPIVSRP